MQFISGLILGLTMILPIGPQNMFVLNSSILYGARYGLVAALIAGTCDSALILAGAAGLSTLTGSIHWLHLALVYAGVVFLLYLGITSLRMDVPDGAVPASGGIAAPVPRKHVVSGVGVSWGNPHAVIDTVVILGAAIAAQQTAGRWLFTAGAVAASWLFFGCLVLAGLTLRRALPPGAHRWIRRVSGVIMVLFAVLLVRNSL